MPQPKQRKSRLKSLFRKRKGVGTVLDDIREVEKEDVNEVEYDIENIPATAPTTPEKEYSPKKSEAVRSGAFCLVSESDGGNGDQVLISSVSVAPSISTGGGKEDAKDTDDVVNSNEIISMIQNPAEVCERIPSLKKPFVKARSQLKKLGEDDEKSLGSKETAKFLEKLNEVAHLKDVEGALDVKTEEGVTGTTTDLVPNTAGSTMQRFSMVSPEFFSSFGLSGLSAKANRNSTETPTKDNEKEEAEEVRSFASLEEGIELSLEDTMGSASTNGEKVMQDRQFVSPSSSFSSIAWETHVAGALHETSFDGEIKSFTEVTGFEAIATRHLELPSFDGNTSASEKNNSITSEGHLSANTIRNSALSSASDQEAQVTPTGGVTGQEEEQDRASNATSNSFFGNFPKAFYTAAQEEKKESDSIHECEGSTVPSLATTSTATRDTSRFTILSKTTVTTLKTNNLRAKFSGAKKNLDLTDFQTVNSKENNESDNESVFEGVDQNGFPATQDEPSHEFEADFSGIEQTNILPTLDTDGIGLDTKKGSLDFPLSAKGRSSPTITEADNFSNNIFRKSDKSPPRQKNIKLAEEFPPNADPTGATDNVAPTSPTLSASVEVSAETFGPDEIDWTVADLEDDSTSDNTANERTADDRVVGDIIRGDRTGNSLVDNCSVGDGTNNRTTVGESTHDRADGESTCDQTADDAAPDRTVGDSTYDNRTVGETSVEKSTHEDITVGNSTHDNGTVDDTTEDSRAVKTNLPDDGSTADASGEGSKDVASVYSHDSSQVAEAKESILVKKYAQDSRWMKAHRQNERYASDDDQSAYTMETNRGAYADDEISQYSRGSQYSFFTRDSKSTYYTRKFSFETSDEESQYKREKERKSSRKDKRRSKEQKENLSTMDELAEMAKELKEEGPSAFIKWLDLR